VKERELEILGYQNLEPPKGLYMARV
jgi:hypothetical protein